MCVWRGVLLTGEHLSLLYVQGVNTESIIPAGQTAPFRTAFFNHGSPAIVGIQLPSSLASRTSVPG